MIIVLVIITRGPGREINTDENDEDDSIFTTPGPASVLINDMNDDQAPRTSTRGTTKASTCRPSNKKRRKKLKKNEKRRRHKNERLLLLLPQSR